MEYFESSQLVQSLNVIDTQTGSGISAIKPYQKRSQFAFSIFFFHLFKCTLHTLYEFAQTGLQRIKDEIWYQKMCILSELINIKHCRDKLDEILSDIFLLGGVCTCKTAHNLITLNLVIDLMHFDNFDYFIMQSQGFFSLFDSCIGYRKGENGICSAENR